AEAFTPITVTRRVTTPRAHADVTAGSNKHGDLVLIFSPAFFDNCSFLKVGDKVRLGYDAKTARLQIAPPAEGNRANLRVIRARSGFTGAGTLVVSAATLPEALPRPEKRTALYWEIDSGHAVPGAAVLLHMRGFPSA
ncbi:MAG: hypothetical protein K2O70_06360, partial [Desulfovibrionaceae bacterium]|nr:hypothetical protein [Desulfovibrionaceae bacterium]